jgi:hypothetical protein
MNSQRKSKIVLSSLAFAIAASTALSAQAATPIDPATLARAQQKLGVAEQVAQQFVSRAAAEGLPETWHTEMLGSLMQTSESAYAQIQAAPDARSAMNLAHQAAETQKQQAQVAAQLGISQADGAQAKNLGDTSIDLTFIPLPIPCRIVDTRASGAGGALAAGATRVFIFGPSSTQGSSSCTPFTGYVGFGEGAAVAVNITVVSAASAAQGSFLKAFPDGGSSPTSWLNFGPSETVANAGILPIASSGNFDVTVNGATNVIVDAFGTFIRPQATALDCTDTTKVTGTLAADSGLTLTSAACPTGYTIMSGSCFGGDRSISYYIQEDTITASNTWFCNWKNYGGTAQNMAVSSHCCRVPGR